MSLFADLGLRGLGRTLGAAAREALGLLWGQGDQEASVVQVVRDSAQKARIQRRSSSSELFCLLKSFCVFIVLMFSRFDYEILYHCVDTFWKAKNNMCVIIVILNVYYILTYMFSDYYSACMFCFFPYVFSFACWYECVAWCVFLLVFVLAWRVCIVIYCSYL